MCTPQASTLSTNLTVSTTAAEQMLRTGVTNTIVLPEGTFVTTNEANRPTISAVKGIEINMVALPWETLYVLQDGITVELWAKDSSAL